MERPEEFVYRGYRLKIEVDEPATEADSGILLTTVTAWPVLPDGGLGEGVRLERNFRGIHPRRESAYDAALARARARIDALDGTAAR